MQECLGKRLINKLILNNRFKLFKVFLRLIVVKLYNFFIKIFNFLENTVSKYYFNKIWLI